MVYGHQVKGKQGRGKTEKIDYRDKKNKKKNRKKYRNTGPRTRKHRLHELGNTESKDTGTMEYRSIL